MMNPRSVLIIAFLVYRANVVQPNTIDPSLPSDWKVGDEMAGVQVVNDISKEIRNIYESSGLTEKEISDLNLKELTPANVKRGLTIINKRMKDFLPMFENRQLVSPKPDVTLLSEEEMTGNNMVDGLALLEFHSGQLLQMYESLGLNDEELKAFDNELLRDLYGGLLKMERHRMELKLALGQ